METYKGTWLMIKTRADYGEPEFIEFHNNQIHYFKVDSKSDSLLEKNQFRKENLSDVKHKILNENRIRIFHKENIRTARSETESAITETTFYTDCVKIEPTITQISKEDILKLEFKGEWRGEKFTIIFNRCLDILPIRQINKQLKREGRKMILENLQGTYFLSIINNGIREKLVGIKEINKEEAVLFGFPEKPYEVKAYTSGKALNSTNN